MKSHFAINVLATFIIATGGFALAGPTPASAATADPCDDYQAAKIQAMTSCANSGGLSFSHSGWCSATGYFIETKCLYDPV